MKSETHLAGNAHRGIDAQVRYAKLTAGEPLVLVREPDNQYDPNAIQVHTEDGCFIGFVPKAVAARFAPLIDAGTEVMCEVGDTKDLYLESYEE